MIDAGGVDNLIQQRKAQGMAKKLERDALKAQAQAQAAAAAAPDPNPQDANARVAEDQI